MVFAVGKYTDWCDGIHSCGEGIYKSIFRFAGMVVELLVAIAYLFSAKLSAHSCSGE